MVHSLNSPLVVKLIKPPEENSTPGTLKALQVSLVEPVVYQFELFAAFAAIELKRDDGGEGESLSKD